MQQHDQSLEFYAPQYHPNTINHNHMKPNLPSQINRVFEFILIVINGRKIRQYTYACK